MNAICLNTETKAFHSSRDHDPAARFALEK